MVVDLFDGVTWAAGEGWRGDGKDHTGDTKKESPVRPTERNRQELDSGEGREGVSQTRKRVRERGREGHLSEEVQA
jgi:hypothetical protein